MIFLQELPANTPHGLEAKICLHSIEVFQQKEIVLLFPPHNLLATHPLQSRLGQPQRCVVQCPIVGSTDSSLRDSVSENGRSVNPNTPLRYPIVFKTGSERYVRMEFRQRLPKNVFRLACFVVPQVIGIGDHAISRRQVFHNSTSVFMQSGWPLHIYGRMLSIASPSLHAKNCLQRCFPLLVTYHRMPKVKLELQVCSLIEWPIARKRTLVSLVVGALEFRHVMNLGLHP